MQINFTYWKAFMKKLLYGLVLGGSLGLAAQAQPLVIEDGYIRAGVSDQFGTLGSNGSDSPGILFDPAGGGNYINNDFLQPGTPFEGFYITTATGTYANNNAWETSFSPFALTQISPVQAVATSTSSDGALSVTHTYTVSRTGTRSEIRIRTVITNLTAAAITDTRFLRTLDPDPDNVDPYNAAETINTILSDARVCGSGAVRGHTICLDTSDSSFPRNTGISENWSRNPDDFLGGINDGNGDYTIGLAFNVGSIPAGGSVTLNYNYLLSDTLSGTGDSVQPVPGLGSYGLVLLTGGLLWLGRRRVLAGRA
jgi:hypothetical protein